ncbi:MAG TPA: hypothetical protein VIT67_07410 [Povalibacter sp.]
MFDRAGASRSPLVIGLSGHRNLHPGCEEQLAKAVRRYLDELQKRMPQTELRIMTGMAQGADLLVAEVALQAGLRVEAVLPLPLNEYLSDFDAPSADKLKSLLANENVHCTELCLPASTVHPVARDAYYANLTEILIDKCSLLLALWNGKTSPLPGGTADTLLRYLSARTQDAQHDRQIVMVPAGAEDSWGQHFVYWIPTPRTDSESATVGVASYLTCIGEDMLAVHDRMPAELDRQLGELNAYNAEFAQLFGKRSIRSTDSLLAALPAGTALGDDASLRLIDTEYAKADALAIYNQQRSNRMFRWFSFVAFLMALLFLVYAKLLPSTVLLSAYLAMLVISFCVFFWIRKRHWFARHLIYRVLAETMRTKFFLRVASAEEKVDAAELMHLAGVTQFSGYGWIGAILKNITPLNAARTALPEEESVRLSFVRQHWIRDQQTYFKSRVKKLERTHVRLERMKRALIYALAALTLLLVLFSHTLREIHAAGAVTLKDISIFIMGLLPVWMGIWELYQNKMATRELLWQYRNQLSHFSRADLQLSRSHVRKRDRSILVVVGKASLMESYLWTIHRFHREHEPPTAG